MDRNERQAIGIDRFQNSKQYGSASNGRGTWNWVTGLGKTYAACQVIEKVLTKFPDKQVLILVPYTNLIEQWQSHVNLLVTNKQNVVIMTVQLYVLNKYYQSPILLILDELDEFYSEERIKIIKRTTCNYTYCLGLTATFEEKQNRHKVVEQYLPIIDVITEQEALDNKWISDFVQFNLSVELTKDERETYDKLSDIISKQLAKFDYETGMSMLTGDKTSTGFDIALRYASSMGWKRNLNLYIESEKEIDDKWNPNKLIGFAKMLNEAVRLRNNLLQHAEEKYKVTLQLVEKFYDVKTIVFSQSINFANKVNLLLNEKYKQNDNLFDSNYTYSVLYHSKMSAQFVYDAAKNKQVRYGVARLKKHNLNCIKKGLSKIIVAAMALDKGFDVKDIRLGIVTARNSTTGKQRQREGRIKRLEEIPYELPVIIVNLYCRDTKDERTLIDSQKKSLKSRLKWIEDIEDVKYKIDNDNEIKIKI